MTNIIIRGRPVHEGGRATRDTASLPPRAAVAHSRHAGRRFVRRDIGTVSFARVLGCGGCQATTGHRSPSNFSRRQGPGSLPSSARIQFLAEQFRGEAPVSHVNSFPIAPELHEQNAAGVTQGAGSIGQERGNFSQGGAHG